jgi:hypothetical protein
VEISRSTWRVGGEATDGANVEYLDLVTTLRANRTVPHDEIALVYDAPGPHAVVDQDLLEKGAQSYDLDPHKPFLEAGSLITVLKGRQLQSSYHIGRNSALTYCPRTVQVVPRNALALALAPNLLTSEGQGGRLRPAKSGAPLVVIMDTLVNHMLVVGAALNTTDTTLRDMVVGLVVSRDTMAHDPDTTRNGDTLEYYVGDVPPHTVAPFAGGWKRTTEQVLGRVAYHSTDVHRRKISDGRHENRASHAVHDRPGDTRQ